ncbi:hypothetical protein DL98DRAFT_578964 [Cadophora sp. DSE1049]|nr:hypothetical protein DL98DRAFT_578964 [Cadophora sp. DSE1049]
MDTSQCQVHPGSTATDASLDDLVAAHGHINLNSTAADPFLDDLVALSGSIHLDPTLTEVSLDPPVTDISQFQAHLGSTAADGSLDDLVALNGNIHLDPTATDASLDDLVAAHGHINLNSTAADPFLDDLVALSGNIHLDPTLTEVSLDPPVTDISQFQVRPGSTASDSSLDKPTTRDFRLWKQRWDKKMLLVRLKREGRDLEYIIKIFWRMDKTIMEQSGWRSMWERSAHDIDVLGRAARADRENEVDRLSSLMSHHSLVDAARIDYEGVWARIAELMDRYGTKFKWNSEKVEYAWTHGVSNMFPDTVLRPRQFSRHISTDFVHSWTAGGLGQHL